MQSGSREYNGRNQYWTPSNIGLTQSMIDTSINRIELKDNTADLFTIENNKIKPTVAMICETPTADEEIVNKKYVDDKDQEVQRNISGKYLTPSQANRMFASISSVLKITYSHFYLYTTDTTSGVSYTKEITDISNYGKGSHVEIPIPSTITGTVIFATVNLQVSSEDTKAIAKLGCTLNSERGEWTNTVGDSKVNIHIGASSYGVPLSGGGKVKKYSLSGIFSDFSSSSRSVYLHFFYNESMTSTASSPINITVTSARPNVEVTIVGI